MTTTKFEIESQLENNWLLIDIDSSDYLKLMKYQDAQPNATHLLAFGYVDHEKGSCCFLDSYCIYTGTNIEIIQTFEELNPNSIFTYDVISKFDIEILDTNPISLEKYPKFVEKYKKEELESFRQNKELHHLRATGFPDNISVMLVPRHEALYPESVWVRVEKSILSSENNIYIGTLLNLPDQDFGIHLHELLIIMIQKMQNGAMAVSIQTLKEADNG
ncbi:hypothetical protein [Arcobacter sp. FWKO B]|uniref:hypothetical protein n=1 Tax=Arcobacter sp. FWKO B TaxID=2593672 RepID=UPI0018A4D353|nr:hypothetical protein [Arcobacter sp. FWKO B]QOG12610.1 hypothetical protein FWKOB_07810 [Arcobacter sp. FWKO B]